VGVPKRIEVLSGRWACSLPARTRKRVILLGWSSMPRRERGGRRSWPPGGWRWPPPGSLRIRRTAPAVLSVATESASGRFRAIQSRHWANAWGENNFPDSPFRAVDRRQWEIRRKTSARTFRGSRSSGRGSSLPTLQGVFERNHAEGRFPFFQHVEDLPMVLSRRKEELLPNWVRAARWRKRPPARDRPLEGDWRRRTKRRLPVDVPEGPVGQGAFVDRGEGRENPVLLGGSYTSIPSRLFTRPTSTREGTAR